MSIYKVTSLTSPLAHVVFHRTQTRVLEEYQDLKDLYTQKKKRNLSSINIHKSLTNSVSLTLKKKKWKLYDPPKKKTQEEEISFFTCIVEVMCILVS